MVGFRNLKEFPVGFTDKKSHIPSAIPVLLQLLEISVRIYDAMLQPSSKPYSDHGGPGYADWISHQQCRSVLDSGIIPDCLLKSAVLDIAVEVWVALLDFLLQPRAGNR